MQLKRNKEMEFEILRKSYRKHIIISSLIICLLGLVLTFVTSRAKYKVDGSIDLAKGTLKYTSYDFKIMAMYKSEDGINYTEIEDRMPSSGYVINEEKSYCTLDNKTKDTNAILKTINGHYVIENLAKEDKCYLYFDKKLPENIAELILSLNVKTTTPTFGNVATTDEGVYKVSDGLYNGDSYYWRGAVTNNYVKFANFCWRIIRINGDNSIRLIYDGATCHTNGTSTTESIANANVQYNPSNDRSNYAGWTYSGTAQRTTGGTASNAKSQLESWYSSYITGANASKVAAGKFCNDRNVASGYTWAISPSSSFDYAASKRIYSVYTPTLSCPSGDIYTLNVGLITADEVEFAGGKNADNNKYYLYNGQHYWTMTPAYWSGSNVSVFCVNMYGYISRYNIKDTTRGLRPVINLKSDVTFSGGAGTLNNPFIVAD